MKKIVGFLLGAAMLLVSATGCGNGDSAASGSGTASEAGASSVASAGTPALESAGEAWANSAEMPAEPSPTEEEAPPDNEWAVETPESHGMDSQRLEEVRRKIMGSQMLGVVIVRDGVIVGEFYQDGYDADSVFGVHSVTKSVMGALIGIGLEEGLLPGVETELLEFYPQLADSQEAGKSRITIEHLLEHTSGIGGGDVGENNFTNLVTSPNWVDYFLSQPMRAEPGSVFNYSTAGSHMLSAVLEKATGKSTADYARETLFGPIGIESAQWDRDPQGITDGGNGLHLSVRDMARFGQLFLDKGSWRGRQIVPAAWVEESTKPHAAGEPDKGEYGYQWWVKPFGQGGEYSGYYALGYAGQFIFVVPELKLVTAVTSKSIWSDYTGQVCFDEIVSLC